MVKVAVFDYGAGNIFSLKNSLERAGAQVTIVTSLEDGHGHSGILLPGVGNFDPAIKSIKNSVTAIRECVGRTPVLGICLGMEMFFERSQEGQERGLGIIKGEIVVLPDSMKVPHMGWNNLELRRPGRLLDGVDDGAWAYFVHSYSARPDDDGIVVADSDYGIRIPAVVEMGSFFGTQFHPEKSGKAGRIILENFLRECSK